MLQASFNIEEAVKVSASIALWKAYMQTESNKVGIKGIGRIQC